MLTTLQRLQQIELDAVANPDMGGPGASPALNKRHLVVTIKHKNLMGHVLRSTLQ